MLLNYIFILGDTQVLKLKCYSTLGIVSCKPLPLHQLLIEELVSVIYCKINLTYITMFLLFFQEKNKIVVDDTIIPSEEVEMYKVCAMIVNEKRLKLRETLKSGFANLKDPQ